jgi:thiol:disulfide interchange protein DsbD
LCFSFILFAQPSEQHVSVKSVLNVDKVQPGNGFKVALKVKVEEGWHINSNKPNEDYLIGTAVSIDSSAGFKLGAVDYPASQSIKLGFSDKPLSVFEKEFVIILNVTPSFDVPEGQNKLVVSLDYQACNNASCSAPSSVKDTVTFTVSKAGTPTEINKELFAVKDKKENNDGSIFSMMESKGLFLTLLFIFVMGLALNLTPCVYPLIPITIGYFGGQAEGNTRKLTFMGLAFVMGMALTYSIVGVVTALTGAIFGSLMQNPIVIIIIVAVLIALSLSMFGFYEFRLPNSWMNKAGGAKGGMFGAFFMGLTMGIVAAPCIGPFVLGLITFVAATANPYKGFLMFFILALGLGTPYLFLAIFSGQIKKLPRSGIWMEAVKHIFGIIMLAMALYFSLPLFPKAIAGYLLPGFMVIAGIYLLLIDKTANKNKGFTNFKRIFSIIIIVAGIIFLIPKTTNSIKWEHYNENTVVKDFSAKKGAIIDFYADWCIPCKELDASTFSDAKVIEYSKDFYSYKADLTKSAAPEVEALRKKYNIQGVPTIIILDSKGNEVKRSEGFINAETFLSYLKLVK